MARPTPVALNRPQRIFGIHPQALFAVFVGIAIGIMTPLPKLLVAILAVAALGGARYCSNDPIGLLVWVRAFFQCAKYEPTQRKVFKLEIK